MFNEPTVQMNVLYSILSLKHFLQTSVGNKVKILSLSLAILAQDEEVKFDEYYCTVIYILR
jgi:hypothetical protein